MEGRYSDDDSSYGEEDEYVGEEINSYVVESDKRPNCSVTMVN